MKTLLRRFKRQFNHSNQRQKVGSMFDLAQKQCVDMDGFVLYVMPDDYIGATIMDARCYETNVTAVIRRHLHPGDTFLDLGGNIGYFSMLASSIVGPTGKVITFEPNPLNLQLLYESQLKNGFTNQTVYPYAVSDKVGLLRFITVGSNGGVIWKPSHDLSHLSLVQAVVVDEVLPDQPIHMVKIDIEAHEPFALRGMTRLIGKHRPKIVTEFHPWAMELNNTESPEAYLQQLEGFGYRLSVIDPEGRALPMNRAGILSHWKSLEQPTIQLDLFCEPV